MFKAEQLVDNSFGREAKITEKAIKKKVNSRSVYYHNR